MPKPDTTLPVPLPNQTYLRCTNNRNMPADYVGDWPELGGVYQARILPHVRTGRPQVHLLGFHAERPYGAFATNRFEVVAEVWLN